MLGVLYELFCSCLQSLQLGQFGAGKNTPNNVSIAKMAVKENFLDFVNFFYWIGVEFVLFVRNQIKFSITLVVW